MASASRAGTGSHPPSVATHPRRGRVDRDRTVEEIETAAAEGIAWLRRQVRANPWETVGVVGAAGWLLGGGLTPRLVGVLFATAGRLVVTDVVSAALRGAMRADGSATGGNPADE
ncbi:MAG: hypothetical protein KIT14_09750 [bacterium]|nr:hypothetical protein [bacterium]